MVAPTLDSEAIQSAPETEVAAFSLDPEVAVLASGTQTVGAAPVPGEDAPGGLAQLNEAFAAVPPACRSRTLPLWTLVPVLARWLRTPWCRCRLQRPAPQTPRLAPASLGQPPPKGPAASPSQEEKPRAVQQEPSQSSARQQANFGPQDRPASSHDTFWKSQTLPEALPGAPAFRPHAEHSRLRLYPLGTTEADEPSRYGHRARHGNDTDKRRPRPSHAARSSCSRRQGR